MIQLNNRILGVPKTWEECVKYLDCSDKFAICNDMVHKLNDRHWTVNDRDKFTNKELANSMLWYINALAIAEIYNKGNIQQTVDSVYILKNVNGVVSVVKTKEPLGISLMFATEELANSFIENNQVLLTKIKDLL